MNCERIQELILTDYLDGVLEPKVRTELEGHLADCPQCIEFARIARKSAFDSFEGAAKFEAPQHLWYRIEEKLRQESSASARVVPSWRDNFRFLLELPRPVWALASVLVLFVAAGTLQQITSSKRVLSDSSAEYIVSLVESSSDISTADNSDFGTDVEQVFL